MRKIRKMIDYIDDLYYAQDLDRRFEIWAAVLMLMTVIVFFVTNAFFPGFGKWAAVGMMMALVNSFRHQILMTLYRRTRWPIFDR